MKIYLEHIHRKVELLGAGLASGHIKLEILRFEAVVFFKELRVESFELLFWH